MWEVDLHMAMVGMLDDSRLKRLRLEGLFSCQRNA